MSDIPEGIPADVWKTVSSLAMQYVEWLIPKPSEYGQSEHVLAVTIARAIMAEREKWMNAAKLVDSAWCQFINCRNDPFGDPDAEAKEEQLNVNRLSTAMDGLLFVMAPDWAPPPSATQVTSSRAECEQANPGKVCGIFWLPTQP